MENTNGYRPSTRIGKYVWDIDLESMDVGELAALTEAAAYFKAKREKEADLMLKLKNTVQAISEAGYHLIYKSDDEDLWIDLNYAHYNGNLQLEEM